MPGRVPGLHVTLPLPLLPLLLLPLLLLCEALVLPLISHLSFVFILLSSPLTSAARQGSMQDNGDTAGVSEERGTLRRDQAGGGVTVCTGSVEAVSF